MIFNSATYILFLSIIVVLYWILPLTIGRVMLFISSLLFYGFWRFEFIPLLLFASIVDYWCSIQIEKQIIPKYRLIFLILSLIINLGILFYFKYLVFFADNLIWALNIFGFNIHIPFLNIILPLGISFYTFETISYTVDVYRKHIKAEHNFLKYATFLVYFPHLIAGPVLRASEILPQLSAKKSFRSEYIISGLKRIIQGLFLKVVLADNISPFVDMGFGLNPSELSAIDVLTLAFMFGLQIYFDFSAYSHIAIGSAKMMGINFPENFNFPYAAISFRDFWKRWHISLSSWIRDYLYLPLTKTKVISDGGTGIGNILSDNQPKRNKNRALFLTWAIMGLWHGANWTFVFWGIYHATFIFIERGLNRYNKISKFQFSQLKQIINWLIVIPIIMLSWIPFRSPNMTVVWQMYSKLFSAVEYTHLEMKENIYIVCALLFLFTIISHFYQKYLSQILQRHSLISSLFKIIIYTIMIILVFTFLRPISQFIYFQF